MAKATKAAAIQRQPRHQQQIQPPLLRLLLLRLLAILHQLPRLHRQLIQPSPRRRPHPQQSTRQSLPNRRLRLLR